VAGDPLPSLLFLLLVLGQVEDFIPFVGLPLLLVVPPFVVVDDDDDLDINQTSDPPSNIALEMILLTRAKSS
jgi:hypothetical protein